MVHPPPVSIPKWIEPELGSFWTVRAQGMVMAYYNLFSVTRIPDAAFRGAGRVIFTLAVPMLLVANVPVKVLLQKLDSPAETL
jgi:ABC-type uncharacterized transport system permease subunit